MTVITRFFLALALLLAFAAPLRAAETVVVRAGAHGDHDRLVMDWKSTVDYKLSGRAPNYELLFQDGANIKLPNMSQLKRIKSVEIRNIEPLILAIQLTDGHALSVSRIGKRIVLDAAKDKRKQPQPEEKKEEKPETIPDEKPQEKNEPPPQPTPKEEPVVKDEVAALKKKIDDAVRVAPWSESQDAGAPPPAKAEDKKADEPKPPTTLGPGGRPLTLAEIIERKKLESEQKPPEAAPAAAPARPAAQVTDEDSEDQQEQFLPLPGELPEPAAVAKIKLKVPEKVKFAAFMRGVKLWVVLDQPNLASPTDENDGEPTKFGPVTRYQVGGGTGTAYRIQLQKDHFPAISKTDNGELLFTIYQQAPLVMPVGLPVTVETPPDGAAYLHIADGGFSTPLRIADPDVGDEIVVLPAAPESGAVTDGYRWPQLETLPALHGAAVAPLVDNILVTTDKNGANIARPPMGLKLSGVKGLEKDRARSVGSKIFDLARWRINDKYRRTKAQMESALSEIRGAERLGRIMQLAQFFFAHGYAHEANGWLRIAAQEFPNVLTVPDYLLLRGAVRVAMHDVFAADRDLSQPGFAYEPEVALWRGWAAAETGDYVRARYFFALASSLLHEYPNPYFKPIAMVAAETALLTGDAVAGGALIDRVAKRKDLTPQERGQLNYLRGLYAQTNNDTKEAEKFWQLAIKGKNQMYAAKSELLLVQDGVKHNSLTNESAIERLEHLRFTWRGDRIELSGLMTLADLYINSGKARQAFENWQTIIRYFAREPQAETARQNISRHFVELFSPEQQSQLQPIEALALYRDFIGYSPTPELREQITRQLIDRLTQVEMYGEAADIYTPLVVAKSEAQTLEAVDAFRLTGIYLLDKQPGKARDVLALVARTALSPEQEAEHRLLFARADFVDGKYEDALQNLMPLSDVNAQRLRADIYWRQQDWANVAKVLPLLMGEIAPDGKLSPDQARLVLQQAVAFNLAGDGDNLNALRERYGESMDQSDVAASFRLITRPPKGSEAQSIRSIQSQLGEVDSFSAFLQNYRKPAEVGEK